MRHRVDTRHEQLEEIKKQIIKENYNLSTEKVNQKIDDVMQRLATADDREVSFEYGFRMGGY